VGSLLPKLGARNQSAHALSALAALVCCTIIEIALLKNKLKKKESLKAFGTTLA